MTSQNPMYDDPHFQELTRQIDRMTADLVNVPILLQTDGATALFVAGLLIHDAEVPELAYYMFDPGDTLGKLLNSLTEQLSIKPEIAQWLELLRKGSMALAIQHQAERKQATLDARQPERKH